MPPSPGAGGCSPREAAMQSCSARSRTPEAAVAPPAGEALTREANARGSPCPLAHVDAGGMAEAQQSRMQEAIDSMVQGLERENIRKMQGNMFRCSADCCENDTASMQQVHHCIERCHAPLAHAQAVVTKELERFQDRLARCTMHCNDKAKDSLDSGSKEQQVKQQLESCVTKCVDDHVHLIPSMAKKMKETLAAIAQ